MSFIRSFLLLCFFSLLCAAVLLFLGNDMENTANISGYAIISADAALTDDKIITEHLARGSQSFSGSPVSQSTQWVLLDEFDSINVIPLDQYSSRVYPFDPRNDGYAEKLNNIFINGNKRFVYIPINPASINTVDREIRHLMADIPFSVEYFGVEKPLEMFFISFASSSFFLILFYFIRKRVNPGVLYAVSMLPLLSSLAFFGVMGFVTAALITGLMFMFHEPLKEIVMAFYFSSSKKKSKLIYENAFEPYKLNWFLMPVFIFAIFAVSGFAAIETYFISLVFISACIVFFFSVLSFISSREGRKRFMPVQIIKQRFVDFSFSIYMLPFACGAFIVMMLTPHISSAYTTTGNFEHIIEEHEYYAHLYYQTAFSKQRLGIQHIEMNNNFPEFFFDTDGLLSPVNYITLNNINDMDFEDFPPFPLKHLMEFFNTVNNTERTVDNAFETNRNIEYISILALLLFIIPGFIFKGKYSYQVNKLKRQKVKMQRKEINLRKNFPGSNRNNIYARKEA